MVRPCVPIVPCQPAEHFASVPCDIAHDEACELVLCEDILLAAQDLKARQTIAPLKGVATALAHRSDNVGHFGHPREHFELVPLFRSTCCHMTLTHVIGQSSHSISSCCSHDHLVPIVGGPKRSIQFLGKAKFVVFHLVELHIGDGRKEVLTSLAH